MPLLPQRTRSESQDIYTRILNWLDTQDSNSHEIKELKSEIIQLEVEPR